MLPDAHPDSDLPAAPDAAPDYLLVGHIAHDVTPHGPRLGGTVSYAAHTAAAFGLRVAVLTSSAPGEPLLARLPVGTALHSIPAGHTTTFENRYSSAGRVQYMYHRAATLLPESLPAGWDAARLVHLGPIAYEVAPEFAAVFGTRPICVTPQGWMRRREADGHVVTGAWDAAERVLGRAALTVLSREDIRHDPGLETVFARYARLMVVTDGVHGGTVYRAGQAARFPAIDVHEVDPTGAGDIFATVLHIALDRLGEVDRAIRIAAYLAGVSVSRRGFASAPTVAEIAAAWARYAPGFPAP